MKLPGVGILLARCAHAAWVRRIGILCLLVLGAGLPLARPEHFWLLLVALPVVCLSRPRGKPDRLGSGVRTVCARSAGSDVCWTW